MTPKFLSVTLCLFLSGGAGRAVAQEVKPLVVPEKTMAARLQTYETPPLSKPMSANRCSNALAVVHVVVDADGKVISVDYVSGYSELKDPALAAVQRWSYKPYVIDGKPVVVETRASVFYLGMANLCPCTYQRGGKVNGASRTRLQPCVPTQKN
jgi:hypothetical protein